jgi:hypothetical protein
LILFKKNNGMLLIRQPDKFVPDCYSREEHKGTLYNDTNISENILHHASVFKRRELGFKQLLRKAMH